MKNLFITKSSDFKSAIGIHVCSLPTAAERRVYISVFPIDIAYGKSCVSQFQVLFKINSVETEISSRGVFEMTSHIYGRNTIAIL